MTMTLGPGIRDVDNAVRAVLSQMWVGHRRWPTEETQFAGRLLSLKAAEGLAGGLRTIHVTPGTVVTPMARDYLKRQGIELRFASRSAGDRARNRGEWGFAIEARSGVLEALRRTLLDVAEEWVELGASVEQAVLWVAENETRGAFVVVDEASLAVFRAYQTAGLRAASVEEPNAAARAVRAIRANLLVVEPAGKSLALLRQIATTSRRAADEAGELHP